MLQIKIILLIIMTILPFALSRYAKYKVRQRKLLSMQSASATSPDNTVDGVPENEAHSESLPQSESDSQYNQPDKMNDDKSASLTITKDGAHNKSKPSRKTKNKRRKKRSHKQSGNKTGIEKMRISFDDIHLK